ncbi:hypothetical protein [Streptomyces sp. NPDC000880]
MTAAWAAWGEALLAGFQGAQIGGLHFSARAKLYEKEQAGQDWTREQV